MILAAGMGTRLQPFTLHHPKALAQVNGKTVLQRNIEYLLSFGIKYIVVNVHHFTEQVITHLQEHNGFGAAISISDETDTLLETGGGIQKAIPLFRDAKNIVVLNADILTDLHLGDMMTQHLENEHAATLAVSGRSSTRSFLFDGAWKLCGWQNTKTGEQRIPVKHDNLQPYAFSGLHIINDSIFRHMPFAGKFSMVDVYLSMAENHVIKGFLDKQCKFMDIGTMEKLAQAAEIFP